MEREFVDHSEHEPPKRAKEPDHVRDSTSRSSGERSVGNRALSAIMRDALDRTQGAGPLDPEIADEIAAARPGGRPLEGETKSDMEGNLGVDLSGVSIHTDSKANELSRSVQAEAFTTGNDIFFKSGKYSPDTTDGRRLLAHELTHVVQQSEGRVQGEPRVSSPDDPHEVEARRVGDEVAAGSRAPQVDRESTEEEEDPMQMSVDREAADEEEEIPEV